MNSVHNNKNTRNIDAVLLWVNGDDENYKNKILPFLNKTKNAKKVYNTRFEQINEIEYAVKSILKFAPFVNNIFIVTDNQVPDFVKNDENNTLSSKVIVVDHNIIFKGFEDFLPTFNSRSIETCIYKIPNLSEHFIYLNDDFFIINPTIETDFFSNEGFPILRGKWEKFKSNTFLNKKDKAGHKKAQDKAAQIIGFTSCFRFRHTPHPLRKSTLSQFFEKNPEILISNIQYKFRNSNQFLPISLANHLELKKGTCYVKNNLQLTYFRSYKKPLFWYKFKLNYLTKNKLFLGLQNLNNAPKNKLHFFISWLKNQ
jgi:hypothetical protein